MTPAVVEAQACDGFAVSPDGSRCRLYFSQAGAEPHVLELPVSGLSSLARVLPEIQQIALPHGRGDASLRVVRETVSWSLERDILDESLALLLTTGDGFEWCFTLADTEVFKMADFLRDERVKTLPPAEGMQ